MVLTNSSFDSGVQSSRNDLTASQRWALTIFAALLHGFAAFWVWQTASLPAMPQEQAPLMVSLISEDARPAPPSPPVRPPEPAPAPKPVVPPTPQRVVPPVLTSTRKAEPQDLQVPVAAPQQAKPAPAEATSPPAQSTPSAAPATVASAPEPSGPPPTLNLPSSAVRFMVNPNPPYPLASKELGETGSVTMMLLIDEAGRVKDVKVTKSSGFPRLDRAAVASYGAARFYPHIVNGVPRSVLAPHTITFNLDER